MDNQASEGELDKKIDEILGTLASSAYVEGTWGDESLGYSLPKYNATKAIKSLIKEEAEGLEGGAPISDKEAWLRIFETIRPTAHSTALAISITNDTFDAMKNKLEAEL